MCRKYEAIGTALIAFGAGALLSLLIQSTVWTAVMGVAAVAIGWLITRKH